MLNYKYQFFMGFLVTGLLGVGCGGAHKPDGVSKDSTRTVSASTKSAGSGVRRLGKKMKRLVGKKRAKPPKNDFTTPQEADSVWKKTKYDIVFVDLDNAKTAEDKTEAQTSQFACGTRSTLFVHNSIAAKEGCSFVEHFDEQKHAAWSIRNGILHNTLKPQVLQVTVDDLTGVSGITQTIRQKYQGQTFNDMLKKSRIDTNNPINFCEVRKREKLIGKYIKEKDCDMSVGPPPELLKDFINNKMIPGIACGLRAEVFSFAQLDDHFFSTMQNIKNRGGIPIVLLFLKNKLTWHYEAVIRINQEQVFLRNTNKRWDVWDLSWLRHRAAPQHVIDKVIASAVVENGPYSFVAIFPN